MTEPTGDPPIPDPELLNRAVAAWRKAQVVHQSPSWEGRPEARALAEEVALHPEFESFLGSLLGDSDQRVAAYALIALELMASEVLTDLPESLLASRSNIALQFGSVRNAMDLGGFARQIQRRAKSASAGNRLAQRP